VFGAEGLDLHVDRRGEIQLHQRVDRLGCGLQNVDQPLVRSNLELLARLLVDVRRAQDAELVLAPFAISTISDVDWSSTL